MDSLWLVVILVTMLVYPIVLVRAALRGRQWALDTLEAMRFVGGDLMTTSAWLALPREPADVSEARSARLEA